MAQHFPNKGCSEINGLLPRVMYCSRTAATAMAFYRDLYPGHSRVLAGHVTPPGGLTPSQAWRQKPFPEKHSRLAGPVSSMTKEQPLSMRYRAVSLANSGMIRLEVAKQLKIGPRTIKRWMDLDRRGETLRNRKGRRRKTAMSRVSSWREN